MIKAQRYLVYNLPYALFVSRICDYKGVNIVLEKKLTIQETVHEIGESTLRQMGFVSHANIFVHKGDT